MSDTNQIRPQGDASDPVDLSLGDVGTVLSRRKWTVIGLALLVTAASLLSSWHQTTTYTSTATIVLAGASKTSLEAQQSLATAKHLAESRTVAAMVADRLERTEPAEELLDGLSVRVPLGTQLLEFRYTALRRKDATVLAQGFADAFRDYQSQLLDRLVSSSQALDEIGDDLRAQLAKAETRVLTEAAPEEVVNARIEVDSLTDQLRSVEQQRSSLLGSAPVVSTEAELASPALQNSPPLKRGAIVGLVAGLVFGSVVAFAVEAAARRRRRRSSRPVQNPRPVPRGARLSAGRRPRGPRWANAKSIAAVPVDESPEHAAGVLDDGEVEGDEDPASHTLLTNTRR